MRNEERRSFIICVPSSAVRVMIKGDELDGACGIHGREVKCVRRSCWETRKAETL